MEAENTEATAESSVTPVTEPTSESAREATRDGATGERSTLDLVRSIATDTATLVKKEVELARQEIVEGVTARLKAVGALAFAGILALLLLGFLGAALAAGLDDAGLEPWASRLIVAGLFLFIAGGAVLFARRKMKSTPMKPEKAQETVKEDVEWAKAQLKR